MTDTTATMTQNYILYRTKAYMSQPGYTYLEGDTPTIPAAQTIQAAGLVIATQQIDSLNGIVVPDGFAYALDADGKYPVGRLYVPSDAYTLSGASTGAAGTALTLTLTPNNDGPTGDVTVTLSDGDAGGTFSANTVTFSGCTKAAQTVTYTPKAAGAVTISATNTGGLTNPGVLSVTASAASTDATITALPAQPTDVMDASTSSTTTTDMAATTTTTATTSTTSGESTS